ncbi:MAG: SDR family NAD(P)-dependent oxidoreductase [Verrucomicrobiota bacterium]
MDIAIVTGAETPLGQQIVEILIKQGCRVHGIGNNFAQITEVDRDFICHAIDLTDLNALQAKTAEILEDEKQINILIHAIDVTPGTSFEKLPVGNLEAILRIGLLGPVMLTRLLLPNLLRFRGQLINIIPANKSGSGVSATNALIEGGLRAMNSALFDQARDAGLRITNLILRQNQSLPNIDSTDEQLLQSRIDPIQVARVIQQLLNETDSNIPSEITLYPRLSPTAKAPLPESVLPIDPYKAISLPPKEYHPAEPDPIPTQEPSPVQRVVPYSDEELEDRIAAAIEDFENQPHRQKSQKKGSGKRQDKPSDQDGSTGKKKRRRRRSGRQRKQEDPASEISSPEQNKGAEKSERSHAKAESSEEKSGSASLRKSQKTDTPERSGKNHQSVETASSANETKALEGADKKKKSKEKAIEDRKSKEPPAKKIARKKAAKTKTSKKAVRKKTAKKVSKKIAAKKTESKSEA